MKINRNAPCWCGSNKKYKKCHLGREKKEPMKLWEIDKKFRESLDKKYCSCPNDLKSECSEKIIRAHTVSKSSSLKKIALDGHVYGTISSIHKIDEHAGKIPLELIGINKASTFTGFCSFHDKELFKVFEDSPFNPYDKEQITLLGYRSISLEFFKKNSQKHNTTLMKDLDFGQTQEEQILIQAYSSHFEGGVELSLRDVEHHKLLYERAISSRNYEEIQSYTIKFKNILPIQCSGCYFPPIDFNGNKLQDYEDIDNILDNINFSILTENESSYAVFSWHSSSNKSCLKFIESFDKLSKDKKINMIFNYTFFTCENVYISPVWWDNLEKEIKEYLKEIIQPLQFQNINYNNSIEHNYGNHEIAEIIK